MSLADPTVAEGVPTATTGELSVEYGPNPIELIARTRKMYDTPAERLETYALVEVEVPSEYVVQVDPPFDEY